MPDVSSSPNADWQRLQDRFYRKQEMYTMLWKSMDLRKYYLAGAPYGGPLAMMRDERKILLLQKQQPVKPMISVYTSAGKLIEQIQWERGHIIGLGWTEMEQLVTVTEDGVVRLYDLNGDFTPFSLGKDAKDNMVIDCQIWPTGLVALTGNFKLIAITNFDEPRPKLLADPGLNEPPHSWAVIPPQYTLSGHVEVLLATGQTVIVIDPKEAQDQASLTLLLSLTQGPFLKMAVSPNGKLLALFTVTGRVWVISSDFQQDYSSFNTESKVAPQQLVWCANDSVVLYWDKVVLMVGPHGDFIKFSYEEGIHLIPEIDGVRIITSDTCEFLQKVPDVTEDIFAFGSTSPSALLYDAFEHFTRKSPRADENIRSIKEDLPDAVDICIRAAGYEFSHHYQKQLLRAASFGKSFLDQYNSEQLVNMNQTLRVLNAVRFYEIGIPITYTQLERATPELLINRLMNRNHHLLALRVAEYLNLRSDKILVHWACTKIKKASEDEDTLCKTIVEKFASKPGLSYAEPAKTAYKIGQPKLATKLLDYEPRAAAQVPLLIDMQEDEAALVKAIESGDTDLVYFVLFHLKRKLPLGEFFRLINNKPLACNLLEVYCKEQDKELLKDFYYQDDRRVESANVTLADAYETPDFNDKVGKMKAAMKIYQDDKQHAFETKAIEEHIRLLQIQIQLEREQSTSFLGLSVSETLKKCIVLGQTSKAASKLRTDFKIPEKRYWWIKLQALVEIRDWEELDKLAKSKKSPIGYEPFVEECERAKQPREAAKYVMRCDPGVRASLFLRIGLLKEAAEQAAVVKDFAMLRQV
ncbi:hypothetical protein BZG36_00636 [Bifiguratus adelaidae]|uniref:Probable vacuolar protein sorting-associated protein 16 homolog n=1 Tax=Bifiguratus adelaidae TaxID=1938954 RepID=A0A261Y7B4_9FUNG|nr:hypothetical protein BZG36_00636 [Bifiguratus adelaidae]